MVRFPRKLRNIFFLGAGLSAYIVGIYFSNKYFQPSAPREKRSLLNGSVYDDIAPCYDSKLALDEWILGITKLRKKRISFMLQQDHEENNHL